VRLQTSTVAFKEHNQLLRCVFCSYQNIFDTMLHSTVSLGYPPTCNEAVIYLSTSENTFQNRPSRKCNFFTA